MSVARHAIIFMLFMLLAISLSGCGGSGEAKKKDAEEATPTEKTEKTTALTQIAISGNKSAQSVNDTRKEFKSNLDSQAEAEDEESDEVRNKKAILNERLHALASDKEEPEVPSTKALLEVRNFLQQEQQKSHGRNSPSIQAMKGVESYLDSLAKEQKTSLQSLSAQEHQAKGRKTNRAHSDAANVLAAGDMPHPRHFGKND